MILGEYTSVFQGEVFSSVLFCLRRGIHHPYASGAHVQSWEKMFLDNHNIFLIPDILHLLHSSTNQYKRSTLQ